VSLNLFQVATPQLEEVGKLCQAILEMLPCLQDYNQRIATVYIKILDLDLTGLFTPS